MLSAYQYSIRYKAGKNLGNADALSRLPQPITCPEDICIPGDVVTVINHLSTTPTSAANIKAWTDRDPVLSKVRRYTLSGWPESQLGDNFTPYKRRISELSVDAGCLLWGSRVIIPPQGRELVLRELHETHPGASKIKSLARSYIWWTKRDAAIEELVKSCSTCQLSRPVHLPHHCIRGSGRHSPGAVCILTLLDLFSGTCIWCWWMHVHIMPSITATKTTEALTTVFATHGLPQKVVTDNGPTFTSTEFTNFMFHNGIKLVHSAPYHPSTNGLAERAVQSFKQALKKIPGSSIRERLPRFLFRYRITPHSTMGVSPAEMLLGRRPRSKLDLLQPSVAAKAETQQTRQKDNRNSVRSNVRSFFIGDPVFAETFSGSAPKWLARKVVEVTGPLSYQIELQQGGTVHRHVDAVRRRDFDGSVEVDEDLSDCFADDLPFPVSSSELPAAPISSPNVLLRRSTCTIHPPDHYST